MTESFVKEELTPLNLRAAFSQFGTGVTIVTTMSANGPVGMTANSFSSVSLDPPLVLWCPAKASHRSAAFISATHFAIHILSSAQSRLAREFARTPDAFDKTAVDYSEHGVPMLGDCLARFECALHAQHDGGDHLIVVGKVERITRSAGKPLLFYGGAYGGFDSSLD